MTAQECCDALTALGFKVLTDRVAGQLVICALPPPEAVLARGADALRAGAALLERHAKEMRGIADMSHGELVALDMAESHPRGQA